MKFWHVSGVLILLVSLCLFAYIGTAQNIDEPTITTTIQYLNGSDITVNYESTFWVGSRSNPNPQSIQKNYSEKMATIETNAQLQIGPTKLDPDKYQFGFMPVNQDTWELIIHHEEQEISRLPIVMRNEPEIVDYLSIVLRPGRTDQDFIMTMLFGPLSTSLRWTISGVPLRQNESQVQQTETANRNQSELTDGDIPDLGTGPGMAQPQIDQATRPLPSRNGCTQRNR